MKKILFALMCASALAILTGCSRESILEKEAVSLVDQIVKENVGEDTTKCTKVDLEKQVSDKKWEGKAYFENGKKIDCVVTDLGDLIEVEIDFNTVE